VKTIEDLVEWLEGWKAQGADLMECRITPFGSPSGYHELTFKGRLISAPESKKQTRGKAKN